jgi:hypothetical protein
MRRHASQISPASALWRRLQRHGRLRHLRWLPVHDKACEAISLRRHCPDQVLGVAIRLSPDDLSAFPADLSPGVRPARSSPRYGSLARPAGTTSMPRTVPGFSAPDVLITGVFSPIPESKRYVRGSGGLASAGRGPVALRSRIASASSCSSMRALPRRAPVLAAESTVPDRAEPIPGGGSSRTPTGTARPRDAGSQPRSSRSCASPGRTAGSGTALAYRGPKIPAAGRSSPPGQVPSAQLARRDAPGKAALAHPRCGQAGAAVGRRSFGPGRRTRGPTRGTAAA